MINSEAQKKLQFYRAKHDNDIARLLRPFYSFRLFVKFVKPFYDKNGNRKDANHFYGIENVCTYNQCLHGHVENIFLDKEMGYRNCIKMAEQKFIGPDGAPLYRLAQIYMREQFPDGKFNTLCREYNHKGEIVEQQDPVITPETNKTLYFLESSGYLTLTEEPIPTAEDFKQLVDKI